MGDQPALLLVGHGSRSQAGVDEYWALAGQVAAALPRADVVGGFIELARPDLDGAIDALVATGATSIVAVPMVLLAAGHLKNDGPAALDRGRHRYPGVRFRYGRDLGIHPSVLAVAGERARSALGSGERDQREGNHTGSSAVVLVGRGSSDPDANSDLFKVARLVSDTETGGPVEPAFVSLAEPGVRTALERCRRLGATRVAVVPYFLFTGVLVERIARQAAAWAEEHPEVEVVAGAHLGPDPRLVRLVEERYRETLEGDVRMNCDLCVYRQAIPGHEHRVGTPVPNGHVHP